MHLGIVGATGLVALELIAYLQQHPVKLSRVTLFSTAENLGEVYQVQEFECEVIEFKSESIKDLDFIIWATPVKPESEVVNKCTESGNIFLDCSGHISGKSLIGDPIREKFNLEKGIVISLPAPLVTILYPILSGSKPLTQITVATYEGVAGAGKAGMDELWGQSIALLNHREVEVDCFAEQIAFNCIPQVNLLLDSGHTKEEVRIETELRQLFENVISPNTAVSITAVRIPIFHGIGVAVTLNGEEDLYASLKLNLQSNKEIEFHDAIDIPTPLKIIGSDKIHVGRYRGESHKVTMWIAADALLVAAILPIHNVLQMITS
jgi:aspartate-semialdehyde dehydrogenase